MPLNPFGVLNIFPSSFSDGLHPSLSKCRSTELCTWVENRLFLFFATGYTRCYQYLAPPEPPFWVLNIFPSFFSNGLHPSLSKYRSYRALHGIRKPSLFLCNGLHPLLPIFGSNGATLGSTHHSLLISEYSSSLVIT